MSFCEVYECKRRNCALKEVSGESLFAREFKLLAHARRKSAAQVAKEIDPVVDQRQITKWLEHPPSDLESQRVLAKGLSSALGLLEAESYLLYCLDESCECPKTYRDWEQLYDWISKWMLSSRRFVEPESELELRKLLLTADQVPPKIDRRKRLALRDIALEALRERAYLAARVSKASPHPLEFANRVLTDRGLKKLSEPECEPRLYDDVLANIWWAVLGLTDERTADNIANELAHSLRSRNLLRREMEAQLRRRKSFTRSVLSHFTKELRELKKAAGVSAAQTPQKRGKRPFGASRTFNQR